MPNTSIVTVTAKQATAQAITDYGAGVAAHLGGDWAKHNAVRVLGAEFKDAGGNTVALDTVRMEVTNPATDVDAAVVVPATLVGESVIGGLPPIIVVQPQSQSVAPGSDVQFLVTAISDTPLTYQWQKNYVPVNGATAVTLVLPNAIAGDAGLYAVTVFNSNGSVLSSTGTLAVGVAGAPADNGGFLEHIPDPLFHAIFG